MTKEQLTKRKIRISSPEESEKVQKKLFELGYEWGVEGTTIQHTDSKYLFTNYDYITHTVSDENFFIQHSYTELSVSELLEENMLDKLNREKEELEQKLKDVEAKIKAEREFKPGDYVMYIKSGYGFHPKEVPTIRQVLEVRKDGYYGDKLGDIKLENASWMPISYGGEIVAIKVSKEKYDEYIATLNKKSYITESGYKLEITKGTVRDIKENKDYPVSDINVYIPTTPGKFKVVDYKVAVGCQTFTKKDVDMIGKLLQECK